MHTCTHKYIEPFVSEVPFKSKEPQPCNVLKSPGLQVAKMSYENKLTSDPDPSSA